MKAFRTYTVAPKLPEGLEGLRQIAYNLWWCWNPDAIELLRRISSSVSIPVIASGGAGHSGHMYDALTLGQADAVLAASIFHFGQTTVGEIKQQLAERGIPVRA